MEELLKTLEDMSDDEFNRLLDEVSEFSNVGPNVTDYIKFLESL